MRYVLKVSLLGLGLLYSSLLLAEILPVYRVLSSDGILSFPSSSKLGDRWTDTNIPVCWENPSPSFATEMEWTENAVARTWEAVSRVDFIFTGQCPASFGGIRILISDQNPHVTALGARLKGKKNGMVLNFTFDSWPCSPRKECIENIAVHEFGHALSLTHEQTRPDSPSWCKDEVAGLNNGSKGDFHIGEWDLSSVMNYCNPNWNNDGDLSETDIRAVNVLYPTLPIELRILGNIPVPPAPSAGYKTIGQWDVDDGGGVGTYNQKGFWMMGLSIDQSNLKYVKDIVLTASNSGNPPPLPPGKDWYMVGYWDVDSGGAVGTDGSRGAWNTGLFVKISTEPQPVGDRVADIYVTASNTSTISPGPDGYKLVGYWDADGGGALGTDGSIGAWNTALFVKKE